VPKTSDQAPNLEEYQHSSTTLVNYAAVTSGNQNQRPVKDFALIVAMAQFFLSSRPSS